ncbi:MAG: CvpA family protein [Brachymonas sp.]
MSGIANLFAGLNLLDILCLVIALLSCVIGMWRGFAFEVLSLAAWAGAFFAAQWGSVIAAPLWPRQWLTDNAQARQAVLFVLIFVLTLLLLGLCASAVRSGMKKTGLRAFDRTLGMAFGLLRAILLLWAATVVIWLTPLHQQPWWRQSQMAPLLDQSLRMMAPWLPVSLGQWLPPALRGSQMEH